MLKKTLSAALSLLLICCAFAPFCLAEGDGPRFVMLGDSIAAGTGIANGEEACYARIVADTIGASSYANYGVDGFTSDLILERARTPEVSESIADADIVCVSMGGNDFIQQNIPVLLADYARGEMRHFDNITANLYDNIGELTAYIRNIAPDAVILVQTLYNPGARNGLGGLYGIATDRVNACVNGYLGDHPGAYEIVDTSRMEKERFVIASDSIHPSAKGNVIMAEILLGKLRELGLTDAEEPVVSVRGRDFPGTITRKIIEFFRNLFDSIAKFFKK